MNVKSKLQGKLTRNEDAEPFYSIEDDRLLFLKQFLKWLTKWQSLKTPCFTRETCAAAYQTTSAMIDFIEYSLQVLEVPYVMPGKLQTDNLEHRFSNYRQMSGGNYNISVNQIFEAEKKIRVKSLLGLKSARYGEIKFSLENIEQLNGDENEEVFNEDETLSIFDDIECNLTQDIDESSVLFTAGYEAFKLSSSLDCDLCTLKVVGEENPDDEYFLSLIHI